MILGLLAFGTAVAFWPGIYGPATSPRWMLLTLALPLLLLFTRPAPEVTWGHRLGFLVLVWAAVTLSWTPQPLDGLEALVHLGVGAAAFIVGARAASLDWFYCGLALGVAVSCVLAVMQWFQSPTLYDVLQWTRPVGASGLFVNSGVLVEVVVLALIAAAYQRMWLTVAVLGPGLFVTQSRGAMLALAVVIVCAVWRHSRLVGALALVSCLGVLVLAGFVGWRSEALVERLSIWFDTARGVSLLGAGLGSFASQFPFLSTGVDTLVARPEHAHNDLLEIAFELGIVGAGLVAALIVVLLRRAFARDDETEALVLVAFVVLSLFSFSMHNPLTLLVATVAAGHVCRRYDAANVWDRVLGAAGAGRDRVRVRTTVQAGAAGASYPAFSPSDGDVPAAANVSNCVGTDAGRVRSPLQDEGVAERGSFGVGGGAGNGLVGARLTGPARSNMS